MPLSLYNSLTRRLEPFAPLSPPKVGFYKCGVTVYGPGHLGHAKSALHFDVMVRWLRFLGYDVTYVQNITDVGHLTQDSDDGEDPVVREARRRGMHPMAVAEIFGRAWLDDMDALHMLRPDVMPRASAHIPEQIELTERLIEKGCAYEAGGSVYFDVRSFPRYGELSGRSLEESESGTRVAARGEKRNPADFALWKRAESEHILRWASPWGEGFPGWHIECSAMSMKYLGETFDIHGGGLDNLFPHHECEIAQSEAATGQPFVRYWLHNNMCTVNGKKMAKSLGNGIGIADILRRGHSLLEKTYEPAVVRHFILTSHYRATLDFSNDALSAAESGSHKLRDTLAELTRATQAIPPSSLPAQPLGVARSQPIPDRAEQPEIRSALRDVEQRFVAAMNDDFNTAAALAVLFDLSKQCAGWLREAAPASDLAAARDLLRLASEDALGLSWLAAADARSGRRDELIQILVDLRADARRNRNFATGDLIRDRLAALGVELQDGPQGTTW